MKLWILTEEKPKKSVVIRILKKYCEEYNKKYEIQLDNFEIVPLFKEKIFTFKYAVKGTIIDGIDKIYLKTVSGNSSFLDYLLFEQEEEPIENDNTHMIMAFEETKTSDEESRNTGVYQRASKFVFIRAYSQTVKTYMLYNDELNTDEDSSPSDTSIFGTNMLLTLGVEILGKENLSWFHKFNTLDELIEAKNSMRRPPISNVPILIEKHDNYISVSGRLVKNGTLSHDPNIGALSIISMCIRKLGWTKDIVITKHGLSQEYITRTRGRNKFLYICKLYNIKLDGIVMPDNYELPDEYWHYEKSSEKVTSILLHVLSENHGILEVYQNHAGCERGYFVTLDKQLITLPKKDSTGVTNLYIPDLILFDPKSNTIVLVEAKKLSTLDAGLEEIKLYDSIEKEYIDKYYPNSTELRYLTLFGGDITSLPDEQVLVHMNFDGSILVNENAPDFIKELFEDEEKED